MNALVSNSLNYDLRYELFSVRSIAPNSSLQRMPIGAAELQC